jgi:hypothetical protein
MFDRKTYTTNTIKAGGGTDFSGGTELRFDRPDGTLIGEECKGSHVCGRS